MKGSNFYAAGSKLLLVVASLRRAVVLFEKCGRVGGDGARTHALPEMVPIVGGGCRRPPRRGSSIRIFSAHSISTLHFPLSILGSPLMPLGILVAI